MKIPSPRQRPNSKSNNQYSNDQLLAQPEAANPGRIVVVSISQVFGAAEVGVVVVGAEAKRIAGLPKKLPDSIFITEAIFLPLLNFMPPQFGRQNQTSSAFSFLAIPILELERITSKLII